MPTRHMTYHTDHKPLVNRQFMYVMYCSHDKNMANCDSEND